MQRNDVFLFLQLRLVQHLLVTRIEREMKKMYILHLAVNEKHAKARLKSTVNDAVKSKAVDCNNTELHFGSRFLSSHQEKKEKKEIM